MLKTVKEKRIISAALTGTWGDKVTNPAIPLTPEEIARSALECRMAGAAIVHVHVRDAQFRPTMDVRLFKETMERIRAKCDVIINITSSGDHSGEHIGDDERRVAPFQALRPEMGSFDCGTMNWMHSSIFPNHPHFLEKLGMEMKACNIKPELEIFDAGMVYNTLYYLKKGILNPPLHYQFVLGAPGGMEAEVKNLVFLRDLLPEGATWSAAGIGRGHLPILLAAVAMGGHVRVGLEDTAYYAAGALAKSNGQLVARAARILEEAGCSPATPEEARKILGISHFDA